MPLSQSRWPFGAGSRLGTAVPGQEVAANLPDMPEPRVESVRPTVSVLVPSRPRDDIHRLDKWVFWSMTGALAASQVADTLTTESVINHGGHEQNPIFGQHPKPAPYAMTNLGIFAAQAGFFYLTEHSKHRVIRWTGRAFITAATVNHARLAACNASINPHDPTQKCSSFMDRF